MKPGPAAFVGDKAAGLVLSVQFLWALPPVDTVVAAVLWWNHGAESGYSRGMMIFLMSVSPTLIGVRAQRNCNGWCTSLGEGVGRLAESDRDLDLSLLRRYRAVVGDRGDATGAGGGCSSWKCWPARPLLVSTRGPGGTGVSFFRLFLSALGFHEQAGYEADCKY